MARRGVYVVLGLQGCRAEEEEAALRVSIASVCRSFTIQLSTEQTGSRGFCEHQLEQRQGPHCARGLTC